MSGSVYSRTLRRAAELIGGRRQLARYLHVPMAELERWIADEGTPPTGIFLKTVDYIIEETQPAPRDPDPQA
jgi:hypothetical protein